MKLTVKTLKGSHFEIKVQPHDSIMAVKKNIEEVQGKDSYLWGQQLLIHNGKVLKDESTLEENKVSEAGFLVVMLSKSKISSATGSSSTQSTATSTAPSAPQSTATEVPGQSKTSNACGQATSNLVAGSNLEQMVQQIMDMGGGNWDKDMVTRALCAAYDNPERAVDYLYSGIPETTEVAVPVAHFPSNQASGPETSTTGAAAIGATPVSGVPNSLPLDLFPQGTPSLDLNPGSGTLDFLRDNRKFQQLRGMVHANPHILQPILQELSKQNPQLLRLIQEHHSEFLQLLDEPVESAEGDIFDQPDQEMHHAVSVTPEEQEAIARLEAMGFERSRVIEAFLACDRNEQLAANYLLENACDDD